MYPFLRFFWVLWRAKRKPAMTPDDESVLDLTIWPWDCDVFAELNNGRTLTLFDLGRFDLGARIGLLGLLQKRKWTLTVGGSSLQYRKRITPLQRVKLRTRFVGMDDKWFYLTQTFERDGTPCSQGLLRTAVVAPGKGIVPTAEVAAALGWSDWRQELPDWVNAWIAADAERPWPPKTL
ncbi:MAG: acyl-CoA thioesterase [Pseudomonadota bacterium]